jgi:hypothetical protein
LGAWSLMQGDVNRWPQIGPTYVVFPLPRRHGQATNRDYSVLSLEENSPRYCALLSISSPVG